MGSASASWLLTGVFLGCKSNKASSIFVISITPLTGAPRAVCTRVSKHLFDEWLWLQISSSTFVTTRLLRFSGRKILFVSSFFFFFFFASSSFLPWHEFADQFWARVRSAWLTKRIPKCSREFRFGGRVIVGKLTYSLSEFLNISLLLKTFIAINIPSSYFLAVFSDYNLTKAADFSRIALMPTSFPTDWQPTCNIGCEHVFDPDILTRLRKQRPTRKKKINW